MTSKPHYDFQHLINHAVINQIIRLASTVEPVAFAQDAFPKKDVFPKIGLAEHEGS